MNRYIRLLSAAAAILVMQPHNAGAQKIDPTVEIVRSYDASMNDILKPAIPNGIEDSVSTFARTFDYSIFDRPYSDLYEFVPYDALRIKPADIHHYPFFTARLGCQYPVMPTLELQFQKVTRKGLNFSLSGRHNSFWGNIPSAVSDYTVNAGKMRNDVSADFKYVWATGEFNAGARYDYDRFSFSSAGDCTTLFDRQALNFNMGLSSAHEEENSIYYKFGVDYTRTGAGYSRPWPIASTDIEDPLSLKENALELGGFVGTTFDVHRVYVDISIRYSAYDALKDYTLGVVEFSPIYEYSYKRFTGKLGVKFGNHFGINRNADGSVPDGNDLQPWSNIFPDIDARMELVKNYLWLHGVIGGGNDMNSYSELLATAPYLSPQVPLLFGSRPLETSLTLESVVFGRMAFNLSGGWCMNRNKAVFAPVFAAEKFPDGFMEPVAVAPHYMDVNRLSVNLEAFWKSADVTTGGEFRYNWYFSPDKLATTELPAIKARYYVRYSWKEKFIASVDFNYRSAISGSPECWYADGTRFSTGADPVSYSVPAIVSLDADVNYVVSKHLMVFLKAGNILNSRNQYVPLFIEPGFNLGAGLTVTF